MKTPFPKPEKRREGYADRDPLLRLADDTTGDASSIERLEEATWIHVEFVVPDVDDEQLGSRSKEDIVGFHGSEFETTPESAALDKAVKYVDIADMWADIQMGEILVSTKKKDALR